MSHQIDVANIEFSVVFELLAAARLLYFDVLNNLVGQVEFAREAANVGDNPELDSFRLALECFPRFHQIAIQRRMGP